MIEVDAGQMVTVLVDLLVNALDAMPGGGRVKVLLQAPTKATVCIVVSDSGDGISPTIMDKLYTPFASTKTTGSGLGLSISKRIIEEHQGSIDVTNQPQGSARFTITLPGEKRKNQHVDTVDH